MKIYVNFLSVKPLRKLSHRCNPSSSTRVSQTETKFTRSKDALTIAILAQYDSMCFVLNVWPPDQFAPHPCPSVQLRRARRYRSPVPARRNLSHVAK